MIYTSKQLLTILIMLIATMLSGCVEQKTYRLSDLFNATKQTETMDVYLAPFQAASWDKYDALRRDPATNARLGKSFRVKFLAEALLIAAFVPGAMNADDELSLPPALLYEGLLVLKPEIASNYLDFMSENRHLFHRELNQNQRIKNNKQLHATVDKWLKANGYLAGVQGLLQNMGTQPLNNLLKYHIEFRNLPGGEKGTPWLVSK